MVGGATEFTFRGECVHVKCQLTRREDKGSVRQLTRREDKGMQKRARSMLEARESEEKQCGDDATSTRPLLPCSNAGQEESNLWVAKPLRI